MSDDDLKADGVRIQKPLFCGNHKTVVGLAEEAVIGTGCHVAGALPCMGHSPFARTWDAMVFPLSLLHFSRLVSLFAPTSCLGILDITSGRNAKSRNLGTIVAAGTLFP